MKRCLFCHETLVEEVSWNDCFGLRKRSLFCDTCYKGLEEISGERCDGCGRKHSLFPEQYRQNMTCLDCIKWEGNALYSQVLQRNISLYVYNETLKAIIAKMKYRGDAELAKGFQQKLQQVYTTFFHGYAVVPIPLSEERHYERGFNQAELLAQQLNVPYENWLTRQRHENKQSKKTRSERLKINQHTFLLHSEVPPLTGTHCVLIDDVYTTGATIRAAALILKQAGALSVSSITIGR
ncbi:phosphoribosyltransferase [Fictibacillus macauensis ZFHKF-1]|uniref:Phosphoribosyltransferase n=1 Tax=Fictibacillus macauensis ZFHKF-1 TaxID=1196324 RepID=I8J556_9BACL|nr:ComF family protein [Fictibacillus macauensis]EIT86936.1 phosphoribosyltransferase [Fictibacillus macauensis ZFHKF-1]